MFRRLVSRNVFYWTRNFWGRMIGSGEMSRRYAQGSTLQGLRLALLVVGASAGAGCFSSKECSSVGCLTPIVVTATLRGTVPGMHKATFCKRGQCESALLDLLAPSEATVDGPLFVRFVSEPTDHGLIITASVLGAPSFEDGESLSFTVTSDTDGDIVRWSDTARYHVVHDIGGPGCGDCFSFRATVDS